MRPTGLGARLLAAATIAALVSLPHPVAAQTFTTEKFNIGGDGGFDYLSVDPNTGRVFVSRGSHIMVVDGATGKVVGDIGDTPRTHGALLLPNINRGFTTNGGDSTSTMFDLKTLAVIKKIHAGHSGLDGFMYDDGADKVLTIDHSPRGQQGTAVVIDPHTGEVVTTVMLNGNAPEGGVSNGKGRIFINSEDGNAVEVVDDKTWKVIDTWPVSPCEGPTGIAMDRESNRLFVGCSTQSIVLDASTGKIVAQIPNGRGVDSFGWDQAQKLMYIPAGDGTVTVVHEDSPDKYSVVTTVQTMRGARTLALDPRRHVAYVFTPEYGPAPAPAPGSPPPTGRGRGPRGPVIASWLIAIKH